MQIFLFLLLLFITITSSANSLEDKLKQAIYHQNKEQINQLLINYLNSDKPDPILINYAKAKLLTLNKSYEQAIHIYRNILSTYPELNSIRMELAIVLFITKQDKSARIQFNKVKSVQNLPQSAYQQIEQYIELINQRNNWQIDVSFSYIRTNNVANVSYSRQIENTGFMKNEKMLPQKAHGISYYLNINRDFNILNSHYFRIQNELFGKLYWDNHQYDDIFNRITMGYVYKKNSSELSIEPFYEKDWYSGNSYYWANGIQFSYHFEFSPNWKNYTSIEYKKRNFFQSSMQSGHIKIFSNTLIWQPNPKQLFYTSLLFSREKTQIAQYSSDLKSLRIGWLQEYPFGISTKLSFGLSQRQFKQQAVLADILPLDKIRQDKIYILNAQIWKRDWHLWGITPKLNFEYRKQKSNLDTLYSYQDRNFTVIFEKTF